jgi:hypothetical protein
MSEACLGAHRLRVTDALALAASPTFAVMGLSTSMLGSGPTEMLCAATQQSPLSGMTAMYLLMSAFHAGPWLKLLCGRDGR